jgi:hypothetical protein
MQGETITWSDQYLEPAAIIRKYVSIEISDELRLRKILNSGKRERAVWEVDTFFAPFPVQDEKNERPYFAKVFLILDSNTELVLGYDMVKDISQDGHQFIHCITDLMMELLIPSQILVERDETYYILQDICRQLNIPLKKVEQLDSIRQVREDMFNRDLFGWV